MLISLSIFVSADAGLTIKSVTLEEPSSGVISGKDSISVKAVITNAGTSDLDSPFWVKYYVNDRMYGSCSGQCELNYDIPVSQGLKTGQSGEIYWAGLAGDEEWLSIGENEIKFVAGVEGESETVEKSLKFTIGENTLPTLDLEIVDTSMEFRDNQIKSLSAIIKNNGPSLLKNDVIQVGFCIKFEDETQNFGCYGSFIDLREEFCVQSEEKGIDCIMNVKDINIFVYDRNLENLNAKLEGQGRYLIEYYIDDVNGLKNYEDTNEDNNKYKTSFELGATPTTTCTDNGFKCISAIRGCGLDYDKKDFDCGDSSLICCEDVSYCGDGICDTEINYPYPEDSNNCPGDCITLESSCTDSGYKCTSATRGCGLNYNRKKLDCEDSSLICCEDVSYCGDGICDGGTGEDVNSCSADCIATNDCNGCTLGDNCYIIGYRKDEEYCSEDREFINQKTSDASCDNSFECSSNLCIDNECISSGLWQKFLTWFENLFGESCESLCCSDSDCDDSNPDTTDTCIEPDTSNANCRNKIPLVASCEKILDNGDSDDKIDIVFISDKYEDSDIWSNDVESLADFDGINDGFFSVEPMKSNKDKFNIWRVDNLDYNFWDIENGFMTWEKENELKELANSCVEYDTIFLILDNSNLSLEGGFGIYRISLASMTKYRMGVLSTRELVHEFGHAFVNLGDEYLNDRNIIDYSNRPNVDVEGCPKWCSGELNQTASCYNTYMNFRECLYNATGNLTEPWDYSGSSICGIPDISCDLGIDCREGVGCYWNAKSLISFRSSEKSLMKYPIEDPFEFNLISQEAISDKIDLLTS